MIKLSGNLQNIHRRELSASLQYMIELSGDLPYMTRMERGLENHTTE